MNAYDTGFDRKTMDYLNDVSEMDELDESFLFGPENKSAGVPVNAKRTAGAAQYIVSKYSRDPAKTLQEAVRLGGDTDTVASVSLGIVGPRTGLKGLPRALIENIEDGRYGIRYAGRAGSELAAVLPIEARLLRRHDNPKRRYKLVHDLDGISAPTDGHYIRKIMGNLMNQIDCRKVDYIIAIEATGYLVGAHASEVTGIPLINAKKSDLDIENKIKFREPSSPRENLFIYNLPRDASVVVVDDEATTADTMKELIPALAARGNKVLAVVTPLESRKYNARQVIEELDCRYISHTVHDLG